MTKKTLTRENALIASLSKAIGMGGEGVRIARELVKSGVRSRAALRRPEILNRLPKIAQANVLYAHTGRIPLEEADEVVRELRDRIAFCPSETKSKPLQERPKEKCFRLPVVAVGSVRRRHPTVKDFDLMAFFDPAKAKNISADSVLPSLHLHSSGRASIARVYNAGPRKFSFVLTWKGLTPGQATKHFRVDIFLALTADKPYALFHYTGSRTYNLRTRALAKKKGWLLNQYGLFDRKTRKRVPGTEKIKTEKDLAEFLGVRYRTPEERDE